MADHNLNFYTEKYFKFSCITRFLHWVVVAVFYKYHNRTFTLADVDSKEYPMSVAELAVRSTLIPFCLHLCAYDLLHSFINFFDTYKPIKNGLRPKAFIRKWRITLDFLVNFGLIIFYFYVKLFSWSIMTCNPWLLMSLQHSRYQHHLTTALLFFRTLLLMQVWCASMVDRKNILDGTQDGVTVVLHYLERIRQSFHRKMASRNPTRGTETEEEKTDGAHDFSGFMTDSGESTETAETTGTDDTGTTAEATIETTSKSTTKTNPEEVYIKPIGEAKSTIAHTAKTAGESTKTTEEYYKKPTTERDTTAEKIKRTVEDIKTTEGLKETTEGLVETTEGLKETTEGLVETTEGLVETTEGLVETSAEASKTFAEAIRNIPEPPPETTSDTEKGNDEIIPARAGIDHQDKEVRKRHISLK